jgi:hypothetical protein
MSINFSATEREREKARDARSTNFSQTFINDRLTAMKLSLAKLFALALFSSAVLTGCPKPYVPPPAPSRAEPSSTKIIAIPKKEMESRKRLSATAAANIARILDKARSVNGAVKIEYPPKTPKGVIRDLQRIGVEAEQADSGHDYRIIVTKP